MDIIDNHPDIPCRIIPIYNGKNNQFFEENIYLTEEDVLDTHLTKREIFAHKVLNIHSFGTLKVMPDGYVYSDCYKDAVGTTKNTVLEILSNEFERGGSWLNIRVKNECKCCPYNLLCPSESPIERSIGLKTICK